ncbi:T7SS effector LXG polymorphic toxin [Oceanobacillus kimchii]|uniref:T7SS effector LXG polymorphic toxin n=1 Tax=Oceanobacillus kimchii TaxID=746691 RepID=UPI003C759CC6
MTNKVDMVEIEQSSNDIAVISEDIMQSLDQLELDIDQVLSMETFRGKTADKAKNYLTHVHLEIINLLKEVWFELEVNLEKHIDTFTSTVDSNSNAIIETIYLKEVETEINNDYNSLEHEENSVHQAINQVADICHVTKPNLDNAFYQKREAIGIIDRTNDNFEIFQKDGKNELENIDQVMKGLTNAINGALNKSGTDRFEVYKESNGNPVLRELADATRFLGYAQTGAYAATSNAKIMKAAKDLGLHVVESKDKKTGKSIYRINATEKALKELGIAPDKHAREALKHRKSGIAKAHWNEKTRISYMQKAPLSYYDKKTGKHVWSTTGNRVLANYPQLEGWNSKASIKERGSLFWQEGKKELSQNLKDSTKVDLKGFDGSIKGTAKTAGKLLGPLGVGLTYYSNYSDAEHSGGLSGTDAHSRAVQDTVIDTTVSTAVQAGFTAAGTAFIPIPGVGTAIGAAFGLGANYLLNRKGKDGKSFMDKTKGAFHKVKGWFS